MLQQILVILLKLIKIDFRHCNYKKPNKSIMQVVEIKPSNNLTFKIPNSLTCKFSIGNLTLRTVCIYVVSLHPHIISVSPQTVLIDAFQQTQINVMLHWSQQINCLFKSKIRVYIWQLFDDQSLSAVVTKMFNQETDGSCLLFEQLTVDVDIDSKYLKRIGPILPSSYNISRIMLPNMSIVIMTEQMIHKVLNHCEKLAKVKAIYTFDSQYVVQFSNVDEVVSSFCEVRDQGDRLAIFGISCIPNLGPVVCSPDILILNSQQAQSKVTQKKQPVRSSFVKQIQPKKIQIKKQEQIKKQVRQSARQQMEQQPRKQIKQQIKPQIKQYIKEQIKVEGKQQKRQQIKYEVDIKKIQQVPEPKEQQQIKKEVKKSRLQKNHHPHSKQIFTTHNPKDLVKQSFILHHESIDKSSLVTRKRTKSQDFQDENDMDFSSATIDINQVNQWRTCRDFQVRSKKHFVEKTIDVSKKILNMEISSNQKYVYLLLRDCVMMCDTQNISSKKIIKFDPIDSENIHLPTPMLLFNKQKTVIFGNQSYIFWVSLTGQEKPDWKYVQRKEIYCIQVVEQLNLLMIGGKNFSKLAYLGKSTQRSNIKVYSCGKLGKRDHLFTYDIPNCNGQNIIQLKYISTRPNNTKLLVAVTHQNKIFFLRVRAFDHIQVYSVMETQQIGIQQIISLKYHFNSSILICLQKLSQQAYCFKYLKINCSYEKVQIATQSVKLPVVKYTSGFRLGGKVGNQWLTAVDNNNVIYSYYLDWKQPQKTEYNNLIKDCILLQKGAIFRQNTQIRSRIIKL